MASSVIRVHLKDSGSGEFRKASVAASSRDEAVDIVERQEQKHIRFALEPAEAADFERRLKSGQLSGRDKARLFSHMQLKPYKVMKAEEA